MTRLRQKHLLLYSAILREKNKNKTKRKNDGKRKRKRNYRCSVVPEHMVIIIQLHYNTHIMYIVIFLVSYCSQIFDSRVFVDDEHG